MTSWRDNPPPFTDLNRYDGAILARAKALAAERVGVHASRVDTIAGTDLPLTEARLWIGFYAHCIANGEFDGPTAIAAHDALGRKLMASTPRATRRRK